MESLGNNCTFGNNCGDISFDRWNLQRQKCMARLKCPCTDKMQKLFFSFILIICYKCQWYPCKMKDSFLLLLCKMRWLITQPDHFPRCWVGIFPLFRLIVHFYFDLNHGQCLGDKTFEDGVSSVNDTVNVQSICSLQLSKNDPRVCWCVQMWHKSYEWNINFLSIKSM